MKKIWLEYKDFFILLLMCFFIFTFNLSLEYLNFQKFKESKHQSYENLSILQSYIKTNDKGRTYRILKLKSKDFNFYTTTKLENDFKRFQKLSLRAINTGVSFKDYLSKNFYMPSYDFNLSSEQTLPENTLMQYFLKQHQDEKIIEFYGALFFALPVSLELRNDVNYYGIAHLIAISGYHIALIFSLIFFILSPLYTFFQRRFFPYRNARFDLSLIIFVFLFFYTYLIGFVPSFIRSLVMALWGFYLLIKNVKILSFFNLFFSLIFCLALFPQLLFSIGFLFSIMGVFFIFLYLHHFSKYFNKPINAFLLNIWTFLAMIIPVLYFFPLLSFQQLLAIFLSFIFIIFYPLVLILHIINLAGILDNYLLEFFSLKLYAIDFKLHFYYFLSYIILALISIRFKWLALFCVLLNLIPFLSLLK